MGARSEELSEGRPQPGCEAAGGGACRSACGERCGPAQASDIS